MSSLPLPYLYSVLRLVPDLDRGECLNIGLVMFSRPHRFLMLRFQVDETRLLSIWPTLDVELITSQLTSLERIAAGESEGGPMAALDSGERFHWLSNVSNTMIQPAPVHPGVTTNADATFERLFTRLVARQGTDA